VAKYLPEIKTTIIFDPVAHKGINVNKVSNAFILTDLFWTARRFASSWQTPGAVAI